MKTRILTVIAALLVTVGLSAEPTIAAPAIEPPIIVAHKAGPFDAPENTAAAITVAKQKNPALKWVELDIRWNESDFPFLMHDPTVDATTDKSGPLNTFWFYEVMNMNAADYSPWNQKNANGTWKYPQYHGKYTAHDGTTRDILHPAYGYEFLWSANNVGVNILMDVKETPNQVEANKLYQYIAERNYQNKVIYMGSPASVQAMKSFHPDLDYMIIEYPTAGFMRTATSIKSFGATGYAVRQDHITKEFVDYYHSHDIKVFSWTTDSVAMDVKANWDKVINAGVDALITNQHLAATSNLP